MLGKTSKTWDHFEKKKDDPKWVTCKLCKKNFAYHSSTMNSSIEAQCCCICIYLTAINLSVKKFLTQLFPIYSHLIKFEHESIVLLLNPLWSGTITDSFHCFGRYPTSHILLYNLNDISLLLSLKFFSIQ